MALDQLCECMCIVETEILKLFVCLLEKKSKAHC